GEALHVALVAGDVGRAARGGSAAVPVRDVVHHQDRGLARGGGRAGDRRGVGLHRGGGVVGEPDALRLRGDLGGDERFARVAGVRRVPLHHGRVRVDVELRAARDAAGGGASAPAGAIRTRRVAPPVEEVWYAHPEAIPSR